MQREAWRARVATTPAHADRLTVIRGGRLPVRLDREAVGAASRRRGSRRRADPPDYLLLTDADIVHAPDSLTTLVAHAQADSLVLASRMAKLRCKSPAERALIPAFIFFFEMLYPFAWVNRATSATAAAAGGCMLLRADALRQAGGIAVIRSALIDDCALARLMKAQGPIWLGLTERVHSIRAYPAVGDIRHMVARSAYAQLRYSPTAARRHLSRHGAGLPCAAPADAVFGWAAAVSRAVRLGADGARVPADAQVLSRIVALGPGAAGALHSATCCSRWTPPGPPRADAEACGKAGFKPAPSSSAMTRAEDLRSGKGHRDENFPVASWLIHGPASPRDPGLLPIRSHR